MVLGDKKICMEGFNVLKDHIDGVKNKPVFARMSEVVYAEILILVMLNRFSKSINFLCILVIVGTLTISTKLG